MTTHELTDEELKAVGSGAYDISIFGLKITVPTATQPPGGGGSSGPSGSNQGSSQPSGGSGPQGLFPA
jgi:hypothetical protein